MADIYLKKSDIDSDIIFDLVVNDNDVKKDETYITASLLSIFTDASKEQIGKYIDGKIVGNKHYNIDKLSDANVKLYKDGLTDALAWLKEDKIVSDYTIELFKFGNRLDVKIDFYTNKGDIDTIRYSLDESLDILT